MSLRGGSSGMGASGELLRFFAPLRMAAVLRDDGILAWRQDVE